MTITILQTATWDDGKTADVDIVCRENPSYNRCNVPAADLFDTLYNIKEKANDRGETVLFRVAL